MATISALLEARVGLRVPADARSLAEGLEGLVRETGLSPDALHARLLLDTALLARLATALTVPETHFFRIKPQMDALFKVVLPDLASRGRALNLWSAGCSTGEEAYTLAILALRQRALRGLRVNVLGSDLHPGSLETARAARYSAWSFRDTPGHIRESYFDAHSSTQWQVRPEVRDGVRFEVLNLLQTDWGLERRMDLILCRNVMIYFSNLTAQRLIERFADQLQPGGWLVLGPSDPPPLPATLQRAGLQVRFEDGAILYRKVAGARAVNALNPSLDASSQGSARAPTLELSPSSLPAPRPTKPSGLPVAARPPQTSSEPVSPNPTLEIPPALLDAAFVPSAELREGLNALESADVAGALTALRRAAYLEPDSAFVQFALAQALLSSGQHARARVALREALRLVQDLPDGAMLERSGLSVADLRRGVAAMNVMLGAT